MECKVKRHIVGGGVNATIKDKKQREDTPVKQRERKNKNNNNVNVMNIQCELEVLHIRQCKKDKQK